LNTIGKILTKKVYPMKVSPLKTHGPNLQRIVGGTY